MSYINAKRSLTSLRSELAHREAITPFICSTFEDFTIERQYLRDKIFPRLASACIERGTQFLPIDLRWNDASCKTNANSSLVLYQCFEAIEDCAPYFICLLGERYGVHRQEDLNSEEARDTADWLQRNLETAAVFAGNEWLLDEENKYCGITELEIIKASLRERTKYGYYYFRNPDKVREQSMGADLSGKARLMEIYESESEYAAKKMKQLKQQIIDTDLPVKYFKSVEELGNLIFKDWLSILESLYPALNNSVFYASSSEEFRQWSIHETFAETRRKHFIVTQGVRSTQDILTRHAQCSDNTTKSRSSATSLARMSEGSFLTSLPELDNLSSIVALLGERGCGLTATIAYWVEKFQVENPHAVIISHYVECSQEASNITSFMRRCIRELRQQYCEYNIIDHDDFSTLDDYNSIIEAFEASLSLGPCIIILDGLNHLSSSDVTPVHVIKTLSWLPSKLPSSCRIIVSTTPSDITCKHLQSRHNVHIIHMPFLQNNHEKSKVLHAWLGKHVDYLKSQDKASIHTARLSKVPLFHVALANEIRLHGPAGIPEKQLETYIIARNFSDLWTTMIRRWSHDYSWLKPAQIRNGVPMKTQASKDRLNNGWLPDALRLISVSREGLLSKELIHILQAFGYNQKHGISPAHWRMFISAVKNSIYIRSDGLLCFHQSSLREAVDFLLLNGLTSPSHVRHVTPFEISWEVQKFQYHSILVNSFGVFPCDQRLVHELPWQHKLAGDVIGLCHTLRRPDVLVTLWSYDQITNNKYDFINYWKHLMENDFDPVEIYHTMVREAETTMVPESEDSGDLIIVCGDTKCPSIRERIVKKCGGGRYNATEVSYLAYLVGIYFLCMKDMRAAEVMLLKAFKIAHDTTSINDLDYLCKIQSTLGNLYYESKLMEKAVMFYQSVLKTADQVTTYLNFNKVDIVALQVNAYKKIADITVRQILNSSQTLRSMNIEESKDWSNKVKEMVNNAKRLRDLCKIDDGKATIDHILGLLSFYEEQYDESDMLLNKAINQVEEIHGHSHLIIAVLLQDLAKYNLPSECEITDITKKEKLYRRALEIRERKLEKGHFNISQTLVDLGCTLYAKRTRDSSDEARFMLQRAVDMRTEGLGVYHEKTKEARRTLMAYQ